MEAVIAQQTEVLIQEMLHFLEPSSGDELDELMEEGRLLIEEALQAENEESLQIQTRAKTELDCDIENFRHCGVETDHIVWRQACAANVAIMTGGNCQAQAQTQAQSQFQNQAQLLPLPQNLCQSQNLHSSENQNQCQPYIQAHVQAQTDSESQAQPLSQVPLATSETQMQAEVAPPPPPPPPPPLPLLPCLGRQTQTEPQLQQHSSEGEMELDWNSKLESTCRRSCNLYVQEVNRVIYGDASGHPENGSTEYFDLAQNYAIYGNDFLDFPDPLAPSGDDKCMDSMFPEIVPFGTSTLYGTPVALGNDPPGGVFSNFNKQTITASAAAATTAAYYQMCNGMQQNVRPVNGNSAYGMFMGNKVTYMTATPNSPHLVYNQQSTATNFISNSLANAALAPSPALLYSNPMLTTTTQQYLNTFFKETQFLTGSNGQGSNSTTTTTTGIYERLVYAQMLQQQIYHQSQQAAAVAAIFQQKQRNNRLASNNNTNNNNNNNNTGAQASVSNACLQAPPSVLPLNGISPCGRQALTNNLPEIIGKATNGLAALPIAPLPIAANGTEDTISLNE